jgi:hypothetical protein
MAGQELEAALVALRAVRDRAGALTAALPVLRRRELLEQVLAEEWPQLELLADRARLALAQLVVTLPAQR